MKTFLLCLSILFTIPSIAQEVLTLNDGEGPGKASLDQINWLVGYWKGTGLGGDCEELWLPAADNSMTGVFRFQSSGKINFTEYMFIEESGESLTVRLKHFGRDLTPWEEKEKWIEFKLVKLENQTAYFHGITYQRKNDQLYIWLNIKNNQKTWIEEFKLQKTTL